ncbi:6-carboxytetrahydropterin synthase QueD [bacterium]|nr:6-carboxytetrahydropterin synthase QueD [bacterium]
MRVSVYREDFFSAAHHLREYKGKCENVHGHNWRVRLEVTRDALTKEGFICDFTLLKQVLKDILDRLDHRDINATPPFDKINPTAENLGTYIFTEADRQLKEVDAQLSVLRVKVWESEKSCATVDR